MKKSICHNCEWGRKPASDELQEDGYVGCALYVNNRSIEHVIETDEMAEGWVDLKTRPFKPGSGMITNLILMTIGTTLCRNHQQII